MVKKVVGGSLMVVAFGCLGIAIAASAAGDAGKWALPCAVVCLALSLALLHEKKDRAQPPVGSRVLVHWNVVIRHPAVVTQVEAGRCLVRMLDGHQLWVPANHVSPQR
jgi:hypothetical protein